MGLNTIILFIVFITLLLLRLLKEDSRILSFSRTKQEWIIDLIGLFIQGVIIPLVPVLLIPVLVYFFPYLYKKTELNPWYQMFISFVLVDYLYYWNHRYFHTKTFWHIHRLHHSSKHLDVFATSRNTFITSFVFVYLWTQTLAIFLLSDPTYFLAGFALTFALDLWRHCGVTTPKSWSKLLKLFFITPEHHVFHHSKVGRNKNFGANFNWWDKIHGTFNPEIIANESLEKLTGEKIWDELIFPRRLGK